MSSSPTTLPSSSVTVSSAPTAATASVEESKNLDGIALRRKHQGLLSISVKVPVRDAETLSIVYTPGVAQPCLEIQANPLLSFDYTMRGNMIAVLSDGSSVYGLGNAGAQASIPMLETKSVLYKTLAGIDAFPIAIDTTDVDQFVETVRQLAPTFGGFHLDGIQAPHCYEIEEKLKRALNLPVMYGEHSTAVVVSAALMNALRVVDKRMEDVTVVIHGAGPSGTATARLLRRLGVKTMKICDEYGRIATNRMHGMNWLKSELSRHTNPHDEHASLEDCLKGADVYIGFKDNVRLHPDAIKAMAPNAVVFAMSLPTAEITYAEAKAAGAAVVATQLSSWPNALSVSMAYPGIFRGALDVRATRISSRMLMAATLALAGMVDDDALHAENILPTLVSAPVAATVSRSVAQAAIMTGLAQVHRSPQSVERRVLQYLEQGSAAWNKPEQALPTDAKASDKAMELRRRYQGVIEISTQVPVSSQVVYDKVYSQPQAVKACQAIQNSVEALYELTCKRNLVAVITDGSAVLGLGNIGPGAGLPVMEGKGVLFKAFGGVEALPICLQTQSVDELLASIKALTPIFGGINLEDISAPRCFELEERLIAETDIPIFHDDQHGTAVVAVAAILNAVKAVGKTMDQVRIVVNGAGASALSVSNLLLKSGVKDIVICDTKGAIYQGRPVGMNLFKEKIAALTNLTGKQGSLTDMMVGADIFIGLSVPNAVSQDMVRSMAQDAIILAMANPTPEIMPDDARAAGAKIIATGRSDFPNQVNNCLAFPGIFRGALDVRASRINDEMKLAAAKAISQAVSAEEVAQGIIIPSIFDMTVAPLVAHAVAQAAIDTGVARRAEVSPARIADSLRYFFETGHLQDVDNG
jgi:malate dehydrogenase (oxaloacetate-decarboxylating)